MPTDRDSQRAQGLDSKRETSRTSAPAAAPADQETTDSTLPPAIGPYRPRKLLGASSLSRVFLVEDEESGERRALRLIRPRLATARLLARFEKESPTLAELEHRGIPRVHDAGTVDLGDGPQPFIVTGPVEGRLLLEYAAENRLGPRERLELLADVCDAVHAAHEHGVVHRGLDPARVVVSDRGQAAVLGFGEIIATDGDLRASTLGADVGQLLRATGYLSPEQAAGRKEEIDRRADVYALGVIGFELLTGRLPHDVGPREIDGQVRIAPIAPPARLGAIDRSLRGEIDETISRAMAHDRDDRFAGADDLARAIRRSVDGYTAAARPGRSREREPLAASGARSRTLLTVAAVALIVAAAAVAWSTMMVRGALDERRQARDLQLEAEAAALDATKRASEAIETRAVAERERDAAFGAGASWSVMEALAAREAEHRARLQIERQRARADGAEAISLLLQGALDDTRTESVATARKEDARRVGLEAERDDAVGERDRVLGELRESERGRRAEIARREEAVAAAKQSETAAAEAVGRVSRADAARAEAERGEAIALAVDEFLRGEIVAPAARTGPPVVHAVLDRAAARLESGSTRDPEIEAAIRVAIGEAYLEVGAAGRAAAQLERAVELRRAALGEEDPRTLEAMVALAEALLDAGRPADAEPIVASAREAINRLYGVEDDRSLWAAIVHGASMAETDRFDVAWSIVEDAVGCLRRRHGWEDERTLAATERLAAMLVGHGKEREAGGLLVKVHAVRERVLGEGHAATQRVLLALASTLEREGRFDEAEARLVDLVDTRRRTLPGLDPRIGDALFRLGSFLFTHGKYTEAEARLRECLAARNGALGPGDWRIAETKSLLGAAIAGQSEFHDAEPYLISAHEALRSDSAAPAAVRDAARMRVIALYEAWGLPEHAAEFKATADATPRAGD